MLLERAVSTGSLQRPSSRCQTAPGGVLPTAALIKKTRNWESEGSKLVLEALPVWGPPSEEEWLSRTLKAMPKIPAAKSPTNRSRVKPKKHALPVITLKTGPSSRSTPGPPALSRDRADSPTALWRAKALRELKKYSSEEASPSRPTTSPAGPVQNFGGRRPSRPDMWATPGKVRVRRNSSPDSTISSPGRLNLQLRFTSVEEENKDDDDEDLANFGVDDEMDAEAATTTSTQSVQALQSSKMMGRRISARSTANLKRLSNLVPTTETVLDLHDADEDLTDREKQRVEAAFVRFKMPDSHEVHKDDLVHILKHLGFVYVEEKAVQTLADEVSQYASLEYDDFEQFFKRSKANETNKFREVFEEFDEDGNGELDHEEIMKFLIHLGFTPLRSVVKEAMDMVDLNGDDRLQFHEVVLLMHYYRHSEGFSRGEVEVFNRHFEQLREAVLAAQEEERKLRQEEEEREKARKREERRRRKDAFARGEHVEFLEEDDEKEEGEGEGEESKEDGAGKENKVKKTPSGNVIVMLPASRLTALLTKFFGPAHAKKAAALSQELLERSTTEEGPPLGLTVSEALVWARRLRDKEFDDFRNAFEAADKSRDNVVDFDELKELCKQLGFSLTDHAIQEMIDKVKQRGEWPADRHDNVLDYDAFVHFMRVLHQTDGFTDKEMEEIETTFRKFDTDNSEDIDVVELNDMLHYLGYQTKMSEVMVLLSRLDYNDSRTLSFRELVRFMRLHREGQYRATEALFAKYKEGGKPVLTEDKARMALADLESGDKEAVTKKAEVDTENPDVYIVNVEDISIPPKVNFDEFVGLAEKVRTVRMLELRRRAGFSPSEILRFQLLFNDHDMGRKGYLSNEEVTRLVGTLGFPLQTVQDQQKLMVQLRAAIATAAENGITCQEGQVVFWVMVQFLRGLYRKDERKALKKVSKAADDCHFKQVEVAEFQEVFSSWYEQEKSKYSDNSPTRRSGPLEDEESKVLTRSSLLRLFKNLGLQVEGQSKTMLDDQVSHLSQHPLKAVDFADFLRLMRWMLDTDFCQITTVVGIS